jgi:hypothetical protein
MALIGISIHRIAGVSPDFPLKPLSDVSPVKRKFYEIAGALSQLRFHIERAAMATVQEHCRP